jgi:hypothetical protein
MSLADESPAKEEHAAHHADSVPAAAATPIDMQAMRNRMREIHQTTDPDKRKALIEAQLKDMEAMMRDPNRNCPMADGKAGMGMMGGKGMGMMGQGMQGGMGMADDMMVKRMEMMMQMRMQGMGGMGMPAN